MPTINLSTLLASTNFVGYTGSAATAVQGYAGSAGGAGIAGNVHIAGTTYFNGNLLPTANNAVNLGSPTARFGTLYISANTIDVGGATISGSDGTIQFGTSTGNVTLDSNTISFLSNVSSQGPEGARGYTGSQGDIGYTGSQGNTGLGFTIAKTYISVAALTADTSPTGIAAGQFALIDTGNVDNAENSRLYLWTGSAYTYVNDLSGAAGITGPQGTTGYTGSAGSQGTTGFTGSTGSQGAIGYTGSAGISSTYATTTTDVTATVNTTYLVDTTSGNVTITLPATPNFGQTVGVIDGAGTAGTNQITVLRNGSKIQGLNSDLIVNNSRAAFTLVYFNSANGWVLTSV